jgi:branched-chain amino acid transport system substrate-binding protein
VQLEDGADATRALQNAKKLIGESNVDAIIGPSTTPAALAILDTIAESKVPLLATVGSSNVVEPMDAKRRWVFKTTQNDDLIAERADRAHEEGGVKSLGFIGFNDPYGENWYRVLQPMAEKEGIRIVASERYARTDQSVTGQSLKLIGAKPDAMFIARGRRARGAAAGDAARPGLEGADLPDARGRDQRLHHARQGQGRRHRARRRADARARTTSPRANPTRKVALAYIDATRRSSDSKPATFGANVVGRLAPARARDPGRRADREAGTEAFRAAAPRCARRLVAKVVGTQGVFTMTPQNHNGMDERARVPVVVRDGRFRLLPE